MAFSTTIQPIQKPAPVPSNQPSANVSDALLSMILLSVYGAHMSKKTVRKLKRRFFVNSMKLKLKSLFSPRSVSDRTLIYIILAAVLLALIIIEPILILALGVVVLILFLAGVL